jgi:hypothetical protein
MKNFLINTIDSLVLGLVKIRYKIYPKGATSSKSAAILGRWKKLFPSTFDRSKVVAPLNPVTADLIKASEKDVPKAVSTEQLNEAFPPQESVNYDGH